MPLTFMGWYNSSISSLHKSVHQLIQNMTKNEFETSPYLSSIQSLNGRTPGEKFKDLNSTVQSVITSKKEMGDFTTFDDVREVSPAMTPLIRVMVGVELKIPQIIYEALQSDDIYIVQKAMNADWFFDGANMDVNASNFSKNIFPHVSLRTLFDIIKKLSHTLNGYEEKAQEFFDVVIELYDIERCLPLLLACSPEFIYESILKHKINLPVSTVNVLYNKYPDVVLKYLQLGNKNNLKNIDERKIHEIRINDYDSFLPRLIKNHPKDFIELYELTPDKMLKLSNSRSLHFLKNSKYIVLEKPKIFLKILPLKVVTLNLKKQEFELMYEYLFSQDINEFNINEMLDYLEFYPHNKFELFKEKFEKVYAKKLYDVKLCSQSPRLWKMLSVNEREYLIKYLLTKYEKSSDFYENCTTFLPPVQSLPIFMGKIGKLSNAKDRIELIGRMILSCSIWNSTVDLLEVLQFYNEKHKNEQNYILCTFFEYLKEHFDLKSLDKNHWAILQEIISHAYVKKELFNSHITTVETVLEAALYNALNNHKDNKAYLNFILDLIIECKIENSSPSWNVLKDNSQMEKECIETFFQLIPLKYPENHAIWKKKTDRLALTLNIVKTINDYNERNFCNKSKKRSNKKLSSSSIDLTIEKKIKIEDYPWIVKLTEEFFSRSETSNRKKRLMILLKRNAPEFYETKIDEHLTVRDIESGEALALLKQNPKKILANWPDYLYEAREKLNSGSKMARRFINATKWHQEIPIKFVERCIYEIKEQGSLIILGILLEGDTFQSIIHPFLPDDTKLNVDPENAKENYKITISILKAMRYTNPPLSFEIINSFCSSDYVSMSEGTLTNVAYRVPVAGVLNFAQQLVNKSISVKKQGIRLVRKVATKSQLKEFLEQMWKTETNPSIRQIIPKMVFDIFSKSPNAKNWELIKSCIDGLTIDHKNLIERFSDIENINTKYLGLYIEAYLEKIESLTKEGLDMATRTKCVTLLIESIDAKLINFIPEKTNLMILNKYFFDTDSLEISRVTQNFAIRYYLLAAGDKFEIRLKALMNILRRVMEKFDHPHPKRPRFYAANYTIHEFFADVLVEISSNESQKNLGIIENMLKVFTNVLSPWQEPSSYLSFNLYKEYLQSSSPQDFGYRCARRISNFVEDFAANESVITDVANCLNDFMSNKIFKGVKYADLILSVTEGLLEGDEFYGYLVGPKLLNYGDIESYDDRYEEIVKKIRSKPNKAIQYNLHNHLNIIP